MVPKAFKEVKQQVDIVGKGRGDHGDSSWKGFAVFSRRTCHYRLCQVIYAHPSFTYGTRGNTTKNCSLFALPGQARAPTLSEPCWGWRDTPYKEGIRPGMLLRSPGSTPATG